MLREPVPGRPGRGLAALLSAWIAAWANRRASAEAFDCVVRHEDDAWRRTLHHECLQNIDLGKEQPDGLWSFDTRVLRDCPAAAAAFFKTVLQRIIWVRTANEELEACLVTSVNQTTC